MDGQSNGQGTRYSNLQAVSRGLRGYGDLLRILAIVVALAGAGLGSWMNEYHPVVGGIAGGVTGTLFGVGIWASGILVSAFGEALMALRDIANNTRKKSLGGEERV